MSLAIAIVAMAASFSGVCPQWLMILGVFCGFFAAGHWWYLSDYMSGITVVDEKHRTSSMQLDDEDD